MNIRNATIIMLAILVCEDELSISKAQDYIRKLDNLYAGGVMLPENIAKVAEDLKIESAHH